MRIILSKFDVYFQWKSRISNSDQIFGIFKIYSVYEKNSKISENICMRNISLEFFLVCFSVE